MDFDRLNKWLTLGANFGVVLGLLILVVEVRQNAKLTRVALEATEIQQTQALETWIGDPVVAPIWRKAVTAPESLTDAEMRVIDGILAAQVQQWWLMMQMGAEGLVSRSRIERAIKNDASFYFGNRFAQVWWATEIDLGWRDTPMAEIADPIVSAVDPKFNERRYQKIRQALDQDR